MYEVDMLKTCPLSDPLLEILFIYVILFFYYHRRYIYITLSITIITRSNIYRKR